MEELRLSLLFSCSKHAVLYEANTRAELLLPLFTCSITIYEHVYRLNNRH